jgi:hypothetical protein
MDEKVPLPPLVDIGDDLVNGRAVGLHVPHYDLRTRRQQFRDPHPRRVEHANKVRLMTDRAGETYPCGYGGDVRVCG